MAKRYDPIMCMMVDEPTKAQDAMPSDLKKAGYEVGTVEKYGSTYYTLVYNGKVISTSPTEANIVEKAKKHYANRHGKAQDAEFQMYGPEFHHPIIKASSKEEAIKKAKEIYGWGGKVEAVKVSDEKYLDKAITTADGATGDKLYADVKAIYNLFSNILLTYTNEQSVQKLANEGTKKCLELAAKVKGVRDEAIRVRDASTGHKVVVFVENYLRSIGKNNSTGKYDRIVQGVRSLLSQSLLDDEGLKKAAEHEADRLLKKYNL